MLGFFAFLGKNAYICNSKKQSKFTIMEEKSIKVRKNYRVTIIFKDEVIIERFYREDIALKTIESMRELTPSLFIAGAVEVKGKNWEIIRTVSANNRL